MTFPAPPYEGPRVRSGLNALHRAVAAYFKAVGNDTPVHQGLKATNSWETSRIVLVDGIWDGSSAPKPLKAGTFGPPWQKASHNPRELASWPRPITVSIRGVDRRAPDSEAAQTEATDALIETTTQALQNAIDPETGRSVGQANIEWGEATWRIPPVEQSFGKELLLLILHKEVLFDLASPLVQASVGPMNKELVGGNPFAGGGASIVQQAGQTAVVGGLRNCDSSQVGMNLTLSGAAAGANNGTFRIVFCVGPSGLVIANAAAVAPDANDGAIAWQVSR